MKILVPIKSVPDPATTIRVMPDGSGIATDNVKWVINPFDEIAIEEALRIKEKQAGSEVVLVTIGQSTWQEQLRTGLAMGADRAILVKSDGCLDPLALARILAKIADERKARPHRPGQAGHRRRLQPGSADAGRDARMAAGDLRLEGRVRGSESAPSCAKSMAASKPSRSTCPASSRTDLRLNEPRYASLPGIMKARKKELKEDPGRKPRRGPRAEAEDQNAGGAAQASGRQESRLGRRSWSGVLHTEAKVI